MKKIVKILLTLTVAFSVLFTAACIKTPDKIELSFDKNTAYFASSKALEPISSDVPQAGDVYEEATIKLTATSPAKMRLSIDYADNAIHIDGLKISVNDIVYDFADEIVIYESSGKISSAQLTIKIYLNKSADISIAGKSIEFYFVMSTDSNT